MDQKQSPKTDTATALGMSYQVALDKEGRRTIVFQTHVPVDAPIGDINALLDKLGEAVDHQINGYRMTEFILVEQELERQIQSAKKDFAYIEVQQLEDWKAQHGGKEFGFKRSRAQEAQRDNAKRNIEAGELRLKQVRDDMQALKDKIAKATKNKE